MTSEMENTYTIKTLMGNWQESRAREEDERSLFLDKCSKGQLAIQKMALLQDTFLKYVSVVSLSRPHLFLFPENALGTSLQHGENVLAIFFSTLKDSRIA